MVCTHPLSFDIDTAERLTASIKWNQDGLVPAIAQAWPSGEVLMMAWMNKEALRQTLQGGVAVYWSRSRRTLWRKGEQSGNTQSLQDIRLDCDGDTLLLQVVQQGGVACHTGRKSCFYRQPVNGDWAATEPVLQTPEMMYGPEKDK